jgi:hypothetical protein
MKLRDIRWLAALALLTATAGLHAADNAKLNFRIQMIIARDGSLVARPEIEVEAGSQAEVRNEDPLKPDSGFKILVTASPLDSTTSSGDSIKLDLAFSGQHNGKWVPRGQHSVSAVLGRRLSFGFPPSQAEPNGKTFELTILPDRASADAPKAK